jgi:hypothetical protein
MVAGYVAGVVDCDGAGSDDRGGGESGNRLGAERAGPGRPDRELRR